MHSSGIFFELRNACVLPIHLILSLRRHPDSGCRELLGKMPVSSFPIMFICSAVWWLKTMWKTISCKQSSEIIWLVEEWYCQAPLLDIIEALKWGWAVGCAVACSTSLFLAPWLCHQATGPFASKEHIRHSQLGCGHMWFCDFCVFASWCSRFKRWATNARVPLLSSECKWIRWKILKV